MSTRAHIALERADGKFECIFNHANGDPESLGRILKRNYRSKQAVISLLQGGDIEFIHPTSGKVSRIADPIDSDVMEEWDFYQNMCVSGVDYVYVFSKGAWSAFTMDGRIIEIP